MLGIPSQSGGTIEKFVATLGHLFESNAPTIYVSAAVIIVILGSKAISPRIPGALIAVVGAIIVSAQLDLAADGVATLGPVPSGLPNFGFPSVTWQQFASMLGTGGAIFIVVLAQSAATSRAYAAKYEEPFDENVDLVGLGLANASAGLSGTFVVNGSPTKTQMVDGAGGKSQLASLTTAAIVLVVLLFLTKPLQYMPKAVLASVVFLIGLELVDLLGLRTIYRMRRDEFVIAVITGLLVIVVGVEQAIDVAIVASVIDHLRRSYAPKDSVVVQDADGHMRSRPVAEGGQMVPGLVVYRFTSGLYYANANRFNEEVLALVDGADPAGSVHTVLLEASAMVDVDYSGGLTLKQVVNELKDRGARFVIAQASDPVRAELDRFGITVAIGADAYYDSVGEAITANRAAPAAATAPAPDPSD